MLIETERNTHRYINIQIERYLNVCLFVHKKKKKERERERERDGWRES